MTATQSGRSTVPRVLIHPPGCQPTRTGRTLLAGFGWFCRLLPRTGLANGTEEAAGWRNALLTASRFSTLQEERREGKTETASSDGRSSRLWIQGSHRTASPSARSLQTQMFLYARHVASAL